MRFTSLALLLCVACSGGDAPPCSSGADCASGRCVDRRCVDPSDGGDTCDPAACDDGDLCNGAERCEGARCGSGSAPPDGTPCDRDGDPATREYCGSRVCAPSRCGDGVVDDAAGELCDDANGVHGDGCDECVYSCTSATECDDGDECSGAEACDAVTHTCAAGTALAEGADCEGGLGRCSGGVCRARACMAAADCDDGDRCNGVEACTASGCAAGPALDCDDGDACTADRCDALAGCVHTLIDADGDRHAPASLGSCGDDCDDGDRTRFPGARDACNMVDDDCDGRVDERILFVSYYADCDGDGYATSRAASVTDCAPPAASGSGCASGGGWTTRDPASAADCRDDNPLVHPGQTTPQSRPIAGAPPASDFDYDCDGTEEPTVPAVLGTCSGSTRCAFRMGWSTTVPECGETGDYMLACSVLGCRPTLRRQTQTCL